MALVDHNGNVVSAWHLDESSSTRVSAVGSHNLADNGSTGSNTGKLSNAADLNGSSQWLSAASPGDIPAGDVDWSIAFWLWMDTTAANQVFICKGDTSATDWSIGFSLGTGLVYVNIFGAFGQGASTFGTPTTGTWVLVAVTYTASTDIVRISINAGAQDAAVVSPAADLGKGFTLGRLELAGGIQYHDGRLDEVIIWSGYVLTTGDITELYNAGNGIAYPFSVAATGGGRPLTNSGLVNHLGLVNGGLVAA